MRVVAARLPKNVSRPEGGGLRTPFHIPAIASTAHRPTRSARCTVLKATPCHLQTSHCRKKEASLPVSFVEPHWPASGCSSFLKRSAEPLLLCPSRNAPKHRAGLNLLYYNDRHCYICFTLAPVSSPRSSHPRVLIPRRLEASSAAPLFPALLRKRGVLLGFQCRPGL